MAFKDYTVKDACPKSCKKCTSSVDAAAKAACLKRAKPPVGAAFLPALLKFRADKSHYSRYKQLIGIVGGKLKYAGVRVKTTFIRGQPSGISRSIYEVLEDFMAERNAASPAGCNKGFQVQEVPIAC